MEEKLLQSFNDLYDISKGATPELKLKIINMMLEIYRTLKPTNKNIDDLLNG